MFNLAKQIKTILVTFTLVFGIVCIISSSGGGGGSSTGSEDPLASLPYTGLMSAAIIDADEIEELMLSAYFDQSYLYALNKNTSSPVLQQNSIQPSNAGALELYSEYGPCGGIENVELEVNENTGDFHGTLIYDGYDDCEYAMTGTIQLSGQLDLQSGQFDNLTMVFKLLELIDNSQNSLVMSGRIKLSENFPSETIRFDLRIRDEDTGKVYWLDNYFVTILNGYDSKSFVEETITGRFYDPDLGYIDVNTVTPVRTYDGDSWPDSGIFMAKGASGATAQLKFISTVLYEVVVDVDGDGNYEYESGLVHYPGANTLPIADAGADTIGNVGCNLNLDGTNSEDADLDILQYEWTITIAPESSLSKLLNASTPTPSFIPDKKGNYQFSLSIFDGYDTVVDTVGLTIYGDLFCLNDVTVIPYGDISQYEADVAIGDVTSDGRQDVLALTREAELYVFNQNSSGGLIDPVLYTVDNWRAVAVGDVTGDGKNDAMVTTDEGIGVLKQNDTGGLDAIVEYFFDPPLASSAYTYSLSLGDFDNNGRLDAAVLPEGGPVYVFLQNLDGTLASPTTYETATDGWGQVLAGDVTGDELTDIVLSRADMYGSDNIAVVPQSPTGGFDTTIYYTIGNLPYTHTYQMVLGDLNGDSRLDIAYELYDGSDENSEHIGILPQSDTGVFDSPVIYNAYYPPIYDMAVGDVTGDGMLDLVVLHGTPHTGLPFSPTTVAIMAATGEGTLAHYDNYPLLQTQQSWGGLAVGDVNGDGKNDVVVSAHGGGPNLVVLLGVK